MSESKKLTVKDIKSAIDGLPPQQKQEIRAHRTKPRLERIRSEKTYVAGTKYHQETANHCRKGDPVQLVRDPANKFDPNAIAVFHGPSQLGFVPKDLAADLRPHFDSGAAFSSKILRLTGGTAEYPDIGCDVLIRIVPAGRIDAAEPAIAEIQDEARANREAFFDDLFERGEG
jgi:hypothetical protein